MEKAIEIKRRAQRCVQNGDLDGALREYENLVETPESDPYNFVLLADLLYKKGEQARASERYLNAVVAYEKAGLYKNAIAVCKKMMRLSLSKAQVLRHLAESHALDGLTSEASIYFAQYAEHMVRANNPAEAVAALRKAFDNGQENVRILEQMSELMLLEGENVKSAAAMREAAAHWETRGQKLEARRCQDRANKIDPSGPPTLAPLAGDPAEALTMLSLPGADAVAAPVAAAPPAAAPPAQVGEPGEADPATAGTSIPPRLDAVAAPPIAETAGLEHSPQFVAPPALQAPPALSPQAEPQPAPVIAEEPAEEGAEQAAGVYEIGAEEVAASYENALEAAASEPAAPPVAEEPVPFVDLSNPTPSLIARRPEQLLGGVAQVEELLQLAQDEFRAGNRDRASQALVDAALTYEKLDRLDSAATIFRSLGRGAQAPLAVMEMWLANCERRDDRVEGSQVACEIGDRALNDGQDALARGWFEQAGVLDPTNQTAQRRLQRMARATGDSTPRTGAAPAAGPPGEPGRVEIAVGRGQAVTFDLASLLQEFQRGVETQLDGDAQGHYDLGMAFREMGLHEQAIESFRLARTDVRLAGRAHEMIGRSLADLCEHAEAVVEFEHSLRLSRLDAAGEAELRFQLALSMAAAGDLAGAVAQLEIADMRYPGRSDITERLADWRRAFGQAA